MQGFIGSDNIAGLKNFGTVFYVRNKPARLTTDNNSGSHIPRGKTAFPKSVNATGGDSTDYNVQSLAQRRPSRRARSARRAALGVEELAARLLQASRRGLHRIRPLL